MSDYTARSTARLATVQALYQMEVSGVGVEAVVREFSDHRFERDVDGVTMPAADEDLFGEILRGVVNDQAEIDRQISQHLATNWRLERLDATLRALLRAGCYELRLGETPAPVVINEYVELAKSFFDPTESAFVNACLDAIARPQAG